MTDTPELPQIMVAPNGARRTKADHPALPMTIDEIVETAAACHAAGAGAIHAHVRDADGQHSLDRDLYAQLIARLTERLPQMLVQVSTEAVGLYRADEQMDMVRALKPRAVSVALREILPDGSNEMIAADFYRWCADTGIAIQHILYDSAEVLRLARLYERRILPGGRSDVLYVLGRYTVDQQSDPAELQRFIDASAAMPVAPDWMICAFGRAETMCLEAALRAGGKVRVGFENSLWHADGSVARSNEERVAAIRKMAGHIGRRALMVDINT
ncbi:BKACE family enzyme [Agrobacterium tumefaciens]|uniref:3-keto-5-aminohexanoate cleavage protein n=1 Tax=Agrobacterium tumefaciens TaxID=358 RepID=UPI0009779605|nr:class III aminotransferase [Agrobacterium tumefaciens]